MGKSNFLSSIISSDLLLVAFILIAFVFDSYAIAKDSYMSESSTALLNDQAEKSTPNGLIQFRTLKECIGEKFMFLPQFKELRQYGYSGFTGGKGKSGHPTYEECVGRIGTIVDYIEGKYPKIIIKMDDNGQIYKSTVYVDSVDGIAPVSDLKFAQRFKGKTLWTNRPFAYNLDTDEVKDLKLRRFIPVIVTDVLAGIMDRSILFKLKTQEGVEVFIPCNISGTNVSYMLRELYSFNHAFFESDPRKICKWSDDVWNALENYKGISRYD